MTAGLVVVAAAAALGFLSLILYYGHCNEDLDPAAAASCHDDPTYEEPLLIGGPLLILALVLLAVHRGRRSAWLAAAAPAVAWAGVLATWLIIFQ